MSGVTIRLEGPADVPAVRDVNRRAFGQDQEADIVDALRANDAVLLSLVAEGAGPGVLGRRGRRQRDIRTTL